MAKPIEMEIEGHKNEDGTHRTVLIRKITMTLTPNEVLKCLPGLQEAPDQNWIVQHNDLSVNARRLNGETTEVEFSKGWNEFVQVGFGGAHYTNHSRAPQVGIEYLTNLMKEVNEELRIRIEKKKLEAV